MKETCLPRIANYAIRIIYRPASSSGTVHPMNEGGCPEEIFLVYDDNIALEII